MSPRLVPANCRAVLPETQVNRVCTDSRQAQAGDLFFALAGDKFDGHDFLAEVAQKGVAAVVVARAKVPAGLSCAVIAVDDPRRALGRLAAKYRTEFTLPVIAVARLERQDDDERTAGIGVAAKIGDALERSQFQQ